MSSTNSDTPLLTVDLVKKHDRPGPRYTSFPTANEFRPEFGAAEYESRLRVANDRAGEPLSLYVHLPFCRKRCSFCACNVVVTRDPEKVSAYLDALERELALVVELIPDRRSVIQYHWGGGTPTHLSSEQMRRLQAAVRGYFEVAADAEVAVEIHPPVTTEEQMDVLRELGFNRLSMGVQDFDPHVQELINRNQSESQTVDQFTYARRAGFHSINLDLVYGLPGQTRETFTRTIERVIELRPERVACYSYAYVPWIKPHQKAITKDMLPPPDLKIELFLRAREMFLQAGYDAIGMDHFAVPEDELALAAAKGTLHRNFMGYTTRLAPDMVALGVSGISDVEDAYGQNRKELDTYHEAVGNGVLPVERGYVLSRDDTIRRALITSLMCNLSVSFDVLNARFGIDASSYFADELTALGEAGGPVDNGFAEVGERSLEITELGRFFMRNVAMYFDPYLRKKKSEKPVFSRTV